MYAMYMGADVVARLFISLGKLTIFFGIFEGRIEDNIFETYTNLNLCKKLLERT